MAADICGTDVAAPDLGTLNSGQRARHVLLPNTAASVAAVRVTVVIDNSYKR